MKAIVCTQYGPPDVLQLQEVRRPSPGENEILVKVHAASVNQYDWHLLTADIFLVRLMGGGFFKPKNMILGADVAGYVEEVGTRVNRFRPGDEVYGDVSMCGNGSFAEYVCASHDRFAFKPKNLSFEQSAAVPMAAVTALQGLRDEGKIGSGKKVLINGASGGVGTFAVQIAKSFGAEVTAVCSTKNVDQARSLGADRVIDYTKEDFTRSGKEYDLIFAANGYHPISVYKRALAPQGIYAMAGGRKAQMFQALLLGSLYSEKAGKMMRTVSAKPNAEDLVFMNGLLESGKVTPVIDRQYPLHQTADAIRYIGEGHARGKVIISVI